MEVWGVVLSRPEPTRAIVGVGKRDISPDNNTPVVREVRDAHGAPRGIAASCVSLNDQHAYLDVPADSPIAVGDLVAFGTPHACTTFDKWRTIVLVDDDYAVQKVVRTYF
jgi:D-serine dehydratase